VGGRQGRDRGGQPLEAPGSALYTTIFPETYSIQATSRRTRSSLKNNGNEGVTEVYVACLGRSSRVYCEGAGVRRALKCEYRFYTALEILQCEGGSNMV